MTLTNAANLSLELAKNKEDVWLELEDCDDMDEVSSLEDDDSSDCFSESDEDSDSDEEEEDENPRRRRSPIPMNMIPKVLQQQQQMSVRYPVQRTVSSSSSRWDSMPPSRSSSFHQKKDHAPSSLPRLSNQDLRSASLLQQQQQQSTTGTANARWSSTPPVRSNHIQLLNRAERSSNKLTFNILQDHPSRRNCQSQPGISNSSNARWASQGPSGNNSRSMMASKSAPRMSAPPSLMLSKAEAAALVNARWGPSRPPTSATSAIGNGRGTKTKVSAQLLNALGTSLRQKGLNSGVTNPKSSRGSSKNETNTPLGKLFAEEDNLKPPSLSRWDTGSSSCSLATTEQWSVMAIRQPPRHHHHQHHHDSIKMPGQEVLQDHKMNTETPVLPVPVVVTPLDGSISSAHQDHSPTPPRRKRTSAGASDLKMLENLTLGGDDTDRRPVLPTRNGGEIVPDCRGESSQDDRPNRRQRRNEIKLDDVAAFRLQKRVLPQREASNSSFLQPPPAKMLRLSDKTGTTTTTTSNTSNSICLTAPVRSVPVSSLPLAA